MRQLLERARALYTREPARVVGYTVTVVVFAASQLHVLLDPATVTQYVAIGLPVVLGVEHARARVTPAPVDDEPA